MAKSRVQRMTPGGVMTPIGPYSHITKAGNLITIGGTAGVDPETNEIVGPSVTAQTIQILESFDRMLHTVGSDLEHVLHINVFLVDMQDFDEMNAAYVERMGDIQPARTAVGVSAMPKPGARLTMNLTAVTTE